MKYYMEEFGEYAWPLEDLIDCCDNGAILLEMKRDIGGEMFCNKFKEFIDEEFIDEECGNDCEFYNPCNGISGRCRLLVNGFIETGKKFVLVKSKLYQTNEGENMNEILESGIGFLGTVDLP